MQAHDFIDESVGASPGAQCRTAMNILLTEPVRSPAPTGAEPVTASAAITRPQTAVQPRARILYVDNEPAIRRLGELVLAPAGYEVDTAAEGAQAWTALQELNYHLLITDSETPRLARSIQPFPHGGINE